MVIGAQQIIEILVPNLNQNRLNDKMQS